MSFNKLVGRGMKELKSLIFFNTFLFFVLLLTFLNSSFASEDYSKYFKEIADVSTWEVIKKLSMEYPDDGVFAEGFSEKVEWLFHNKYSDFFKKEIFKDKGYYLFIKRHIDHTWSYGSSEQLKLRLSNNCPVACEKICKDLLDKIEYESVLENQ